MAGFADFHLASPKTIPLGSCSMFVRTKSMKIVVCRHLDGARCPPSPVILCRVVSNQATHMQSRSVPTEHGIVAFRLNCVYSHSARTSRQSHSPAWIRRCVRPILRIVISIVVIHEPFLHKFIHFALEWCTLGEILHFRFEHHRDCH